MCLNTLCVSGGRGGLRRLLSRRCVGSLTLTLPGRRSETRIIADAEKHTELNNRAALSADYATQSCSEKGDGCSCCLFVLFCAAVVPSLIKPPPPPRLLFCVCGCRPGRERYRRGEMDVRARLCMGGRSNPQWGPPSRTLRLYHRLNAFQRRGGGRVLRT